MHTENHEGPRKIVEDGMGGAAYVTGAEWTPSKSVQSAFNQPDGVPTGVKLAGDNASLVDGHLGQRAWR